MKKLNQSKLAELQKPGGAKFHQLSFFTVNMNAALHPISPATL
ncbi:hypothetical protein [Haliscomenobacter sp.]